MRNQDPNWRKAVSKSKRTGYYYMDEEVILHKKPGPKSKKIDGDWLSQDKKIETATFYAVLRNVEQTADMAGVYPSVVRNMINEPWFTAIVNRVRYERNEELDGKITEALDVVLDLILDRLREGEIYVKKDGTQQRQPMKARDAAYLMEIVFNKRQLLRGEATSKTETVSNTQRLEDLKVKFERLANSKEINPSHEAYDNEPTQGTGEGETTWPDPTGQGQPRTQEGEMRPDQRQGQEDQINASRDGESPQEGSQEETFVVQAG